MKIDTTIANSVTADYIVTEVLGDTYDDAGILKEKMFRWLFRIWTRLNFSLVRTSRRVMLPIAPGTRTMMLPPDYRDLIFLGYPDGCGNWLPLAVNRNLMPTLNNESMIDTCKTCGCQDLCNMEVTVTEEQVVIAGDTYTKTTTRRLNPDGSYVEEVTEPVLQIAGMSTLEIAFSFNNPDKYGFTLKGEPASGDAVTVELTIQINISATTEHYKVVSTEASSLTALIDDLFDKILAVNPATFPYTDGNGNNGVQTSAYQVTGATLVTHSHVAMQTSTHMVCSLPDTCSGCVPATPANVTMLSNCGCTDPVCCCSNSLLPYDVKPSSTHYNLFEQEGFIQFSPATCLDRAMLWYVTAGTCINGIFYFPEQCMEVLISGVYFLSIQKKKNVPFHEKERARRQYVSDRKELLREFTRLSYQEWLDMITTIPRLPSLT